MRRWMEDVGVEDAPGEDPAWMGGEHVKIPSERPQVQRRIGRRGFGAEQRLRMKHERPREHAGRSDVREVRLQRSTRQLEDDLF